jgi:hypothetical protein
MYDKRDMRFEVPQFINVPDKLFGPFTFKQALYLVGGGGIIFIIYKTLPSFFLLILGIPVALFSIALVFYKPNGREFIEVVEAAITYALSQKFFLWRRTEKEENQKLNTERKKAIFPDYGEILEDKRVKISDLARSLDILDIDE